jgi:hypothetical protein
MPTSSPSGDADDDEEDEDDEDDDDDEEEEEDEDDVLTAGLTYTDPARELRRDYDAVEDASLLRFLVDMRGENTTSRQVRSLHLSSFFFSIDEAGCDGAWSPIQPYAI